jgi:hypothetical protein
MCNAGWSSIEAEIGFVIDECHRLAGPCVVAIAALRRYGTLQSMDVKDLKDIPFSENSQREMVFCLPQRRAQRAVQLTYAERTT